MDSLHFRHREAGQSATLRSPDPIEEERLGTRRFQFHAAGQSETLPMRSFPVNGAERSEKPRLLASRTQKPYRKEPVQPAPPELFGTYNLQSCKHCQGQRHLDATNITWAIPRSQAICLNYSKILKEVLHKWNYQHVHSPRLECLFKIL